jgi:bifunctional DNase/RNase
VTELLPGVVLPRPLTHDLIVALVKTLGWTVEDSPDGTRIRR